MTQVNVEISLSSDNRTIANVHNHPNNTPPSPCDLRTMMKNAATNSNYQVLYTLTKDGTYYAFYVTNRNKVKAFWNEYEKLMEINEDNHFEEGSTFYNEWEKATSNFKKLSKEDCHSYALAYLINKYDMGITLMRQKSKGAFTSLHTIKDDKGKYQPAECK